MTTNEEPQPGQSASRSRYQRLDDDESMAPAPATAVEGHPLDRPPAFSLDDDEDADSAHPTSTSSRRNNGQRYNQLPAEDPPAYPADDNLDTTVVIDPAVLSPTAESEGSTHRDTQRHIIHGVNARGKSIQRAITSFFKTRTRPAHSRLATSNPDERAGPEGAGNSGTDGVFSNLSAKPEAGEVKPPGEGVDGADLPPDYSEIAEDQVPPYLDLTSTGLAQLVGVEAEDGEIYIHGYPVGGTASFFISMLVSMSFQFVGFLLTYFLSTSHAGRNGSRAGFGVTLIQFGLYFRHKAMRISPGHEAHDAEQLSESSSLLDNHRDANHMTLEAPNQPDGHSIFHHAHSHFSHSAAAFITADWFAYIMMLTGWFLIIRSISDFIRVKRTERLIKAGVEGAMDNPAVEIRQPESYV